MNPTAEDFAGIFRAIHGVPPFAWQTRLLHTVIESGWPEVVAAPTGTGKTVVLDVALFHLAMGDAARTPAPRRIVFAVDRRVIADQAFLRAKKLQRALLDPPNDGVAAVAAALRRAAGGDAPLHVELLRGGMPREDEWARSPVQPTILCTTVDQLGSRLLFRGYGVSPGMAPIHAGLLGQDALLLLDEAHLSAPFRQTLHRVARQRTKAEHETMRPWAFCTLTATPRHVETRIFDLSAAERDEPAIAPRLTAAKTAELELCKGVLGSPGHVAAFVAEAELLVPRCTHPAPSVAIIVNRVALGRAVLRILRAAGHDAILLTGRARPVERINLLRRHESRLTSQSGDTETRDAVETPIRPLFAVATQCIEAGPDFDFDAMVTQIAPLDALRQRLGRLNRLGSRAAGPAVILAAKDEITRSFDDRLYQGSLRETWEWLSARATAASPRARPTIGINPHTFAALVNADPTSASRCAVTQPDAPVLRAADLTLLAMTNPKPQPDPYLPLFLHGEIQGETDVSIVWRADCEVIGSASGPRNERTAVTIVACQRPVPGEALRVPMWAAQNWLARPSVDATDITDAEAERSPDSNDRPVGGRTALRWAGPDSDDTRLVRAADLRPGDVIVVPSSYGGCDGFGWAPAETGAVKDIANEAAAPYASRYFSLRLHPALWKAAHSICWEAVWPQLQEFAANCKPTRIVTALDAISGLPSHVRDAAMWLKMQQGVVVELPYDDNLEAPPSGVVLIAPRGLDAAGGAPERPVEPATEDDFASCFADGSVTLTRHTRDVVANTRKFAEALQLSPRLAETLSFAAEHHDDGKADPRFQDWLKGPNSTVADLLAKSGRSRSLVAESVARATAGVPARWRHEVLSVRIATRHLAAAGDTIDQALALYLIGSHHGYGRPFFPHHDPWDAHDRTVLDAAVAQGPGPERLDFDWQGRDWAELFADLETKYGAWGLAFLEAVLRLADHRASEKAT